MLPGGGNAGVTVDNALVWSRAPDDEGWEITQDPDIGLSVFQPVFVNGQFIDPSVMNKTRRNGEIGWEISRIQDLATRNQVLTGVLAAVHRVTVLRGSVHLLEQRQDLAELRFEMAREDRNMGRISEADLLSIELDVGRQREALFDARYRLALVELELTGLLGVEDVSEYTFDLTYGVMDGILKDSRADFLADLSGNPEALRAALEAEQKKLTVELNAVDAAPVLSFSLQAGPRYPAVREAETAFSASFTDLFSEDADVDVSVGFAVQFDAWDGGVTKARRKAGLAALTMARESRDQAERAADENRRELLARLGLLNDRIALLESNIAYDRRLLQREIDRQALGASVNVDVETVRLELLGRDLDVENLIGERYLLGLQLLFLAGRSVEEILFR